MFAGVWADTKGDDGWDVAILNKNLGSDGDEFTAPTASGVSDLLGKRYLTVGDAVVLPGPIRIARVTAQLGGRATPGSPPRPSRTR